MMYSPKDRPIFLSKTPTRQRIDHFVTGFIYGLCAGFVSGGVIFHFIWS